MKTTNENQFLELINGQLVQIKDLTLAVNDVLHNPEAIVPLAEQLQLLVSENEFELLHYFFEGEVPLVSWKEMFQKLFMNLKLRRSRQANLFCRHRIKHYTLKTI